MGWIEHDSDMPGPDDQVAALGVFTRLKFSFPAYRSKELAYG